MTERKSQFTRNDFVKLLGAVFGSVAVAACNRRVPGGQVSTEDIGDSVRGTVEAYGTDIAKLQAKGSETPLPTSTPLPTDTLTPTPTSTSTETATATLPGNIQPVEQRLTDYEAQAVAVYDILTAEGVYFDLNNHAFFFDHNSHLFNLIGRTNAHPGVVVDKNGKCEDEEIELQFSSWDLHPCLTPTPSRIPTTDIPNKKTPPTFKETPMPTNEHSGKLPPQKKPSRATSIP